MMGVKIRGRMVILSYGHLYGKGDTLDSLPTGNNNNTLNKKSLANFRKTSKAILRI